MHGTLARAPRGVRHPAVVSWVTILCACARGASSHTVNPETRSATAVEIWVQSLPHDLGRAIYVKNNAERPILVMSVSLSDCHNVAEDCSEHVLDRTVAPNETARVLLLTPKDASTAHQMRFGFTHQWRYVDSQRSMPLR